MNLEQLFNDFSQQEIEKRNKEQAKKAKMHSLRCQWCENTFRKLSFLMDKGIRLESHCNAEFPYLAVKSPSGWAFIDITSEHVWKEEDLNDETFYLHSNTSAFPCKSRIGWESIMKEVSKWI